MTGRTLRLGRILATAGALFVTSLAAKPAAADVTLVDKDGWSVFINGRMQMFLNYNQGDNGIGGGTIEDANHNAVQVKEGMSYKTAEFYRRPPITADNDPGEIQDFRIREGFTGNVLGFGIKKKINDQYDILGYSAATMQITSSARRKYLPVYPDWRQSFLKVSGPFGSVTGGRDGCLFSRGATEITFLYGYKYGLGFPGNINGIGEGLQSTAGHVGFGVLANAFCTGFVYATPNLFGAQLSVALYDALILPGSQYWERAQWPRGETELTFEQKIGTLGMFKLFANGLYQKIYEREGERDSTIWGAGAGGRVEVGMVHFGLAGHYGQGVGLNFSMEPANTLFSDLHPSRKFRKTDGLYGQLMVSPLKQFDVMAGLGVTEVQLLKEDKIDYADDDSLSFADGGRPSRDDDAFPGIDDSSRVAPVHRQIGASGGVAYHLTENLHLQGEYFRAIFTWYKPSPSADDAAEPVQTFDIVNFGVTYDF